MPFNSTERQMQGLTNTPIGKSTQAITAQILAGLFKIIPTGSSQGIGFPE